MRNGKQMAFVDFHDVGQIATMIGIPSIIFGLYLQIKSIKKSQREEAEKARAAISQEIIDTAKTTLEKLEYRLEALKSDAVIERTELMEQKKDLAELRKYVDQMDKEGTTEWLKVKPFMLEKLHQLHARINKWEEKMNERQQK